MVIPVYDARLGGRTTCRDVREALVYRNRSTLSEADSATSSRHGQEQSHAGKGTAHGSLNLQLGACRDLPGRSAAPYRSTPTELRDGTERGGLCLAQID